MTGFTVSDVPEDDLQMVADLLRICRAAPPSTRGDHVRTFLGILHPEADDATMKRIAGWTAKLLDGRD